MKSSIVFFDSFENSKKGTLRGLVIFPIYIILTLIWFYFTKKTIYDKSIDDVDKYRLYVSLGISALIIVSAIGVHTPNTTKKAIFYAGSIGLIIYTFRNATLLSSSNKWGYGISVIDTTWGVISSALLGFILYKVVESYPSTFAAL
jgi:uncharacterized membrane protein